MKPYVTYAAMFDNVDPTDPYFDDSSPFAAELQKMTGAWQTYGINTPIYLVDILDTLGLTTMLCVSSRASDLSNSVVQAVGLDAIKTFEYPWKEVFSGSDRLDLIIYYCEKLLEATVPAELRTDACGDPMDAQGIVSAATAEDLIELLKADTDALVDTPQVIHYYHWMVILNGGYDAVPAATKAFWDDALSSTGAMFWDTLYKDPFTYYQSDPPTWPGTIMIDSTLASDPDYFLRRYNEWATGHWTQDYSSWWVAFRKDHSPADVIDFSYGIYAAKQLALAAEYAVYQVTQDRNDLSNVFMVLRNALSTYNTAKQNETEPNRVYWTEIVNNSTGISHGYPIYSPNSADSTLIAQTAAIRGEMESLPATLLRDANFIKANGTHGYVGESVISIDDVTQAYNLFKAVHATIRTMLLDRGTTYRDGLLADQAAHVFSEDSLISFLRPYLL